jgi:hypothetical protein
MYRLDTSSLINQYTLSKFYDIANKFKDRFWKGKILYDIHIFKELSSDFENVNYNLNSLEKSDHHTYDML